MRNYIGKPTYPPLSTNQKRDQRTDHEAVASILVLVLSTVTL